MASYSIETTVKPDTAEWLTGLLAFFKDEHIRYNEGTAEDNALRQYLETAIGLFELHSGGRTVLSTTYKEYQPRFGTGCKPLQLHRGDVTDFISLSYYDTDDQLQTIDFAEYGIDLTATPALVWMFDGASWPALNAYRPRPVVIEYRAGWAEDSASSVPAAVKQGIFLLATHYYTYRGDEAVDIPQGFIRLANKYHTGIV